MYYASSEIPMTGDRIRNSAGKVGTVTSVARASCRDLDASRITIKWDEGVIDIDYTLAEQFILISRRSVSHSL